MTDGTPQDTYARLMKRLYALDCAIGVEPQKRRGVETALPPGGMEHMHIINARRAVEEAEAWCVLHRVPTPKS